MPNIDTAGAIQTGVAAPALVDPQVASAPKQAESSAVNTSDAATVEISSEALQASAVQQTPSVDVQQDHQKKHQQENSQTATQAEVEETASPVELDSTIAEASINDELDSLRQKTAENRSERRQTVFRSGEDGSIQVTVRRGDKEYEIPPDEIVSTKSALKQRLQAFVEASNLDINV